MKRALAVSMLLLASLANATVPETINFSARLVDEDNGRPVVGAHDLSLSLYDVPAGGAALWTEARPQLEIEDGLVFAALGEIVPLDLVTFDGRALFLEITLDGTVMEPRVGLASVPYAFRSEYAAIAERLGALLPEDVQPRVTETCAAGSFIQAVNADGTVECATDGVGIGTVVAGSGLQGGGSTSSVTLSLLQTCANGQVLKWNGMNWACANDIDTAGAGDITDVLAGSGLQGGGATGSVTLSLLQTCANNQVLKWNNTTWVCAADVDTDTNSGGDITDVLTGAGSGLQGGTATGSASLSLLTSCANNQILKWSAASTAWACSNDVDTDTNAGGDITDVIAGNGLTGGAAAGSATLDVGAGTGITVAANTVALDTTFTDNRYDPRYVNATGDTMSGNLDMAQSRVLNRGCPSGYARHGLGLCMEDIDDGGLTFSLCANKCRVEGTHICSAVEIRAAMQSGTTIGNGGVIGDWAGDQDAPTTALVINSNTDTNAFISAAVTDTTKFCRCCANVE